MKRAACLALAMSMVMGTTAFAAERNPIVLVNRQEFFLQDTAMQKNGKWLFSAEDLAEMTGSQMTNLGESLLFTTKTVAEDAERQMERTVVLQADGMLDVTAKEKDRLYLGYKINRENGKCFLPVREFANEMGYTMTWDRFLGSDWIYLKELRTPDVTLTVEYDKKTNSLQGTINNKEPQSFLYGNAFTLERLTENGWECVAKEERKTGTELSMQPTRSETGENGMTTIEKKTKGGLAAGVYRMGIPFSFTYYYGGYQASAAKAALRKNPDKKAYDFYYATTVAEPNFYFRGDGLCSTWDAEITTNYTLYGTFTVE